MHVSDHGGLLRARDEGEQPVTPLELFFDLAALHAERCSHSGTHKG